MTVQLAMVSHNGHSVTDRSPVQCCDITVQSQHAVLLGKCMGMGMYPGWYTHGYLTQH